MSISALTILQRLNTRAKFRHMQALIALCDLGSMSRAAQALGISQPAMSQLVAELEKLIETQLFLRHSKGVNPTPVALNLLSVARRIIAAAEEGAEHIASHQRRDEGLVRIASTAAASGALLHVVLPEFAKARPGIQIQINTVLGPSLDASFSSGEYDIVCSRSREVVPEGWAFSPCVADDLVPVCGARHPLASRDQVTMQDLGQAIWLQNHVSTVARQHFDSLAQREGWHNIQQIQVLSRVPILIWTMLKSGKYLTLVPRSVVASWLSEGMLCELSVDLDIPLAPLGYHWQPDVAGSATKRFVNALSAAGNIN